MHFGYANFYAKCKIQYLSKISSAVSYSAEQNLTEWITFSCVGISFKYIISTIQIPMDLISGFSPDD